MPIEPSTRQGSATDTLTHFILLPIFTITFGVAIYLASRAPDHKLLHWWLALVAFALFLLNYKTRVYSLKVQDRVIRLEERLRIAALVPSADMAKLSMKQLIALRFASDAELPSLVARTITQGLDAKAIKEKITTWRPDNDRV